MDSEDNSSRWRFEPNTRVQHTTPKSNLGQRSDHQWSTQEFSKQSNIEPGDLLINIEDYLVDRIIGKCGKRINILKKISGASISIGDIDTSGQRTIQISGDAKAKELALKLINDSTIPLIDEIPKKIILQKIKEALGIYIKPATKKPVIKEFYKEHNEVSMMSNREIEDFILFKNNIVVKYIDENNMKPIPKPIFKFSHVFEDYAEILEEIHEQQFEIPLPIQCQAWPIIMSGHDLVAVSQTGSGKTLCFLLPALIHINSQRISRSKRIGPSILVLVPNRELVLQIESEVKKYNYKGIKAMSIYGGENYEKQKRRLQNKIEFVIATPGRLHNFVKDGAINLSQVTLLILDEADRLLDLGFKHQIHALITTVRQDRQTILTSATWPQSVTCFAKSYMNNPIQLIVGSLNLETVNTVKQEILIMKEEQKEFWLDELMKNLSINDKVIIFLNCKKRVYWISRVLCIKGFNIEYIHGSRKQCQREQALKKLRNGEVSILIATNVVCHGIDINNITIVINYDFPWNIEEYVHRVGRTGRAGKTGLTVTFMTENDWGMAKNLIELMKKSGQYISPQLQALAKRFEAYKEQKLADGQNRLFRDVGGGNGGI